MNKAVKLVAVGNSTGAVLPKEVLAKLRVERGDQLYLTEAPDGSFRLSAYDPDVARQMEEAEAIMRKDRNILRVLAQ